MLPPRSTGCQWTPSDVGVRRIAQKSVSYGKISDVFGRCWIGYWCPGTELNRRHEDFQSSALPTELPGHPAGGTAARKDNTASSETFPFAALREQASSRPVPHLRGQIAQRLRGGAEVGDRVERGL